MKASDFRNMIAQPKRKTTYSLKTKQEKYDAGYSWPMPEEQRARVCRGNRYGAREVRGCVYVIVTPEDCE